MTNPQYSRLSAVPDHLATRFELRSWGLRPGGPAVATVTVIAKVSGVARQEKLYRVTEAVAMDVEPAESPVRNVAAGGQSARSKSLGWQDR